MSDGAFFNATFYWSTTAPYMIFCDAIREDLVDGDLKLVWNTPDLEILMPIRYNQVLAAAEEGRSLPEALHLHIDAWVAARAAVLANEPIPVIDVPLTKELIGRTGQCDPRALENAYLSVGWPYALFQPRRLRFLLAGQRGDLGATLAHFLRLEVSDMSDPRSLDFITVRTTIDFSQKDLTQASTIFGWTGHGIWPSVSLDRTEPIGNRLIYVYKFSR